MSNIHHVVSREILDSRGNPTLAVTMCLENGICETAMVPSGASTGVHEALELRDGDSDRYNGKGVLKAVSNVNNKIAAAVLGVDASKQRELDTLMCELDGTENKSKLGANAILGVSMAAMKCAARARNMQLYEYIGSLYELDTFILPVPMMNIINGGKHADSGLDIQEFMIVPAGAYSFREALRMGAEIFHTLKAVLSDDGLNTSVGDEGGYAPNLPNNQAAFEKIIEAAEKAGYKMGKDVFIAIDAAASEFYDPEKGYLLDGTFHSSEETVTYYKNLIDLFPIISVEDGLAEDDWNGWRHMNDKLGNTVQLVGDDLLVTNPKRLQRGIDEHVANSILIKLNQIGTVSETLDTIKLASNNSWKSVISHRSGETCDTTIADLAVGVSAGQIKTGSLCRSERISKYNRLLMIEENLGLHAKYPGSNMYA